MTTRLEDVSSLLLRTQTVLEGWSALYAGLKKKINSLETSLATFATKLDNIEEVRDWYNCLRYVSLWLCEN